MKLFPSNDLVARIELAEAHGLEAIVAGCGASAFRIAIGGGFALYRGPGSPFNKAVGLGFSPLTAAELTQIEHAFSERGVPTQIELATHADPALSRMLCARGYELSGFENVLGRPIGDAASAERAPELSIERVASDADRATCVDVLTEGFAARLEGEVTGDHDVFDRAALEGVFRDMAGFPSVAQWLARWNGEAVGAASMGMRDGIAQLFGTAVLPHARRRGVQSALIATRLSLAREQGCDLAVVTTNPGSQSHQNMQRAGFELLYARAVWLREP